MTEYQHILIERDELVGIVTLNRPEQLNALNFQLVRELGNALQEFDRDETIGCIIITGAGEKAFAAGADIKEMADKSPVDMMIGGFEGWETIRHIHNQVVSP
jgi:enoyl-CoA hydratase